MKSTIEAPELQQVERTYVLHGGKKLSYFAGCDYFRMSSDPRVLKALAESLAEYGLNVAASRLTTGNHKAYRELEAAVCGFFGAEAAVSVSNGYLSNLVAAQALAGSFSHALLDERAHSSLVDAAQFLECPVLKFKHQDVADCKRVLERCGSGARPILLTDGMYSYNGSAAPLAEYLKLLPRDGKMLVDDAHGGGVIGQNGGGAVEHAGVARRRVIQTVTLSKAFGVYGGAILGSDELRNLILEKSRMFIGNTPLPLPLAGAAVKAVEFVRKDKKLLPRMRAKAERVKNELRAAGLDLPEQPGPIVPLAPTSKESVEILKKEMLKRKIYPSFIRYPGGPAGGYFRLMISSEHTEGQLDDLVGAIVAWVGKVGK